MQDVGNAILAHPGLPFLSSFILLPSQASHILLPLFSILCIRSRPRPHCRRSDKMDRRKHWWFWWHFEVKPLRRHGITRFIVLPMKPSLISPRAPRCLCNLQTILLGANIFLCQGKGKRNRQVLHPPGDKLFQWYFTTDFVCKFVTFI